ncbi:BTB-domain-containing protein [Rhizophagus irregularis]|uniref:BTB-domain-containing protein n=1 Tax=Rhizophagus irregularis TaxID=588596 RepID=A0A2N1NLW4_9GLOM|nr:BTB-domain-containing protein [Rhizophagus irregularis]
MFGLWKLSSEDFYHLLESGEFADTEILVGEEPNTKIFKAHSLILTTRSKYFRTAFSNNWIRTEDNNIITLHKPNISVEVFDILIKFIYSGVIKLSDYDIRTNVAVLIAADELNLNEFCEHTEKFLLNNERSLKHNFVLIQKTVHQLSQFEKLTQFYETSINKDPSLILRANDFVTIQQDALIHVLSEYNQRLNPIEVWDKLIEWAIGQSNELPKNTKEWTNNEMTIFGTIINPFITHINFEKISLTNFCNNIKPFKDIFDKEFYVQILEHYSFNAHSKFKIDIDSKIITPSHAFLLGNLIKMTNDNQNCTFEFQLLIRGSRDGFTVRNFHKNCDEKGRTITIASVKNSDEIVGGYNPLDWNPKCEGKTDECFIFSLDKKELEKFVFSKVVDENHAVYRNRGPDFGEKTSDLRLIEGDAKKGQCHKNSYEKLIRQVEGVFEIEDYEVFQVIIVNQPCEFVDEEVEVEVEVEVNEYNGYEEYYEDYGYRSYYYEDVVTPEVWD